MPTRAPPPILLWDSRLQFSHGAKRLVAHHAVRHNNKLKLHLQDVFNLGRGISCAVTGAVC